MAERSRTLELSQDKLFHLPKPQSPHLQNGGPQASWNGCGRDVSETMVSELSFVLGLPRVRDHRRLSGTIGTPLCSLDPDMVRSVVGA